MIFVELADMWPNIERESGSYNKIIESARIKFSNIIILIAFFALSTFVDLAILSSHLSTLDYLNSVYSLDLIWSPLSYIISPRAQLMVCG